MLIYHDNGSWSKGRFDSCLPFKNLTIMDYNNFSEYWEAKKDLYAQLGVTKASAKQIWFDAQNVMRARIVKHLEEDLKRNYIIKRR